MVLVKKLTVEQQLGDYSLPQMSTSSYMKEKNPENTAEPQNQ